jgi:hypothetical protein
MGSPRVKQHPFRCSGLSGIDMGDNADIPGSI